MTQGTQAVKQDERRHLAQDPARLRWRRRAAGLSMGDLAKKSSLAKGTISNLERGTYSAEPATLAKLAAALGCQITDIMPDEPNSGAA